MRIEELKEKALSLPLSPGVYIMKDKNDKVIYVGKAKKLKNRVSQYFQDTAAHGKKTELMVSKVDHFDVIVTASEFEALVLECSLIKRHMPKYNILLKDDKGFPYLRVNMKEEYPSITVVSKIADDGAEYFGPFGSRGVTNSLLESILIALKLPRCGKKFPRDLKKCRACLNFHMDQCEGWCQGDGHVREYREKVEQARQLLTGNHKSVINQIRTEMIDAADNLNFELAASLRNRIAAIETLGRSQNVTAGAAAEIDVIGYGATETRACFTVLHFSGGNLLDKDYEVFSLPDNREAFLSSLLKQYYLSRGFAPKVVLLPFDFSDRILFEQLLEQNNGKKTRMSIPKKGERLKLVSLAVENAQKEAERATDKDSRIQATWRLLGKMLTVDELNRIESFDVSNISGTDIVAGMVVFQDGKPKRSDYKRFKIRDIDGQDDYASMYQAVYRRFENLKLNEKGFSVKPDILFIDGGVNHAKTARSAVESLGIHIAIFGMVKDDRHRTRALVTPDGDEIRIDNQQSIFTLIGTIQEETHRFAISYHRNIRSKRLRYSELDDIPGIGSKRKQLLLRAFKSLTAIKSADLYELERILPHDAAASVYNHFNNHRKG